MTLGGTLIVRNAFKLDYCLEAALRSLLGVCDQVVVVDGHSDDGTSEWLRQQAKMSPYLNLFSVEWNPNAMGLWLSEVTNIGRALLETDVHFCLQADEVLSIEDYQLIREYAARGDTYAVNRLNFWMDAQHILPPEEKVGSCIVRLAPTSLPSIGDAQGLDPTNGFEKTPIRIWHYGFLRRPEALASKGREMQKAIFNSIDPIWDAVDKEGAKALIDPSHATAVSPERLLRYDGTHPAVAHNWLNAHGYKV